MIQQDLIFHICSLPQLVGGQMALLNSVFRTLSTIDTDADDDNDR